MSNSTTSSVLYAAVSNPAAAAAVPETAKGHTHHLKNGKGFANPWPSFHDRSGWQIGRSMIWRALRGKSRWPDTTPPTVPYRRPSFLHSRMTSALRATWLGHACYYVEFPSGFRVLFDPVFEARCSPFSFLGPKRFTPSPCQVEDIPIIDAVIISHSHYDHTSLPTIKKIKEKHPEAHFFVPLRLKKWFQSCGVEQVTELDWWESSSMTLSSSRGSGKRVTPSNNASEDSNDSRSSDVSAIIGCLPCQHTSARTPFDQNHTLWASWSVASGGKKVWFGGDTGYRSVPELPEDVNDYDPHFDFPRCPAFREIGENAGPFDLGLIPIGAYDPRYIMSPMHANPFDSVNIFKDTKCKRAMGIHWGTWVLTEEDVLDPPRKLRQALVESGIPEEGVFDVCDIGESREFPDPVKPASKI